MTMPLTPDAEAFHQFLGAQLQLGVRDKSPEELLAQWRAEHPSLDEVRESIAALKEALADMEAGDAGRPASDVIADLRQKYDLPSSA
jgi:hypothetical protein